MLRLRVASRVFAVVFWTVSCAGRAPAPPAAHVLEVENALLWRVSDGSDAPPLYLLGSVHALDVPLEVGPRLTAIFAASPELLVEVDSREIDPLAFFQTAAQLGRLAPLQSLDDYVDAATRERLDRFLAKHPAPPMLVWDLDHTAPWLLWFWVSVVALEEWGFDMDQGVETWFLERAGDGRSVVGLETMAEQFEAMAAAPLPEQGEALAEVLADREKGGGGTVPELEDLLDAWKAGDAEALWEVARPPPGFEREIVVRRNERMASRLGDRVRRGGPRLAIVGAMHLVGEQSIVEGLRLRGLRVERVR